MIKKSALAFGFFLMFFGTAQADSLTFQRIQREAAGGSAEAENKLGVYYAIGLGVTQDDYEAVTWYRLAAEQGYAEAQFNLGEMYEEGRGVPKSIPAAMEWYEQACTNGWGCGCKKYRMLSRSIGNAGDQ
ncbi:MAG: sel1 repeat family protein [Chlorobiaceae bacterium]|jgi:uncharacterized protein|nr:sel1 repeat family protein [Chlorobiaceae bacterium]